MRKILNIQQVLDYFFLVFLVTFLVLPVATYLSLQNNLPTTDIFVAEPSQKVLFTLKADKSGPYNLNEVVPVKLFLKPSSSSNMTLPLGIFSTTIFIDKNLSVNGTNWLHNANYSLNFFQKSKESVGNYNQYVALKFAEINSDTNDLVPFNLNIPKQGLPYLKFNVTATSPGTYKIRLKNDDPNYKHVLSDGSQNAPNYFDSQSLNNVLELTFGSDSTGNTPPSTPICGNGNVEGTEACDDGNTKSGDGCSGSCTVENGWECSGSPSSCSEVPGNPGGGSAITHSACVNNACVVVDGAGEDECSTNLDCAADDTSGGSESSSAICGNGNVEGTEACDDGNTKSGDGCSGSCTVENGWECSGSPSSCSQVNQGTGDSSSDLPLSSAKNLVAKVYLEGRSVNGSTSQLGYYNPTVFVGLWRPSQKKFVISKIVESPTSGNVKVSNFFTTAPKEEDVIIIKPESYLSKDVELKDSSLYTVKSNGDLELNDLSPYLAGDVIVDIGSFDKVNVRDYVFYRSYFGSGRDYIVYYLDYNGNNRVDIFDFGYYINNINKRGASEKYGLDMIKNIENAISSELYKVIRNTNDQ